MKPTGAPRTAQYVRPARSIPARVGPGSEQDAYVRLSQLAREKHRLHGEQELWQRKLDRITKRLTEIDSQMDWVRRQVPEMQEEERSRFPGRLWQEIEFPY